MASLRRERGWIAAADVAPGQAVRPAPFDGSKETAEIVSQTRRSRFRRVAYPLDWWLDAGRDGARRIRAKIGEIPAKIHKRIDEQRLISLRPAGAARGHVLMSYMIEPFLLGPGESLLHAHSRFWEANEMATAFLERGFVVDVIRYTNQSFMPRKRYDFLIDARWNMERLADQLGPGCFKIMHLDTSHLIFQDTAELNRLLDLYRRRGVALQPRRLEAPNHGLETADCATLLGNDFTLRTYAPAHKPIHLLPVTPSPLHPSARVRDVESSRRNFLWFNSMGMVHKGLDLTLEAFVAMPDLTLTVCGMVDDEPDFVEAYRRELFETPNIRTLGWVDVSSFAFREIADTSIGFILPSCSEGQSGSAITCIQAGLIPILTRECGVDVDDEFGIVLTTCGIDEIKAAVRRVAGLPAETLRRMSEAGMAFVSANHTRERFARVYRGIVDQWIDARGT